MLEVARKHPRSRSPLSLSVSLCWREHFIDQFVIVSQAAAKKRTNDAVSMITVKKEEEEEWTLLTPQWY